MEVTWGEDFWWALRVAQAEPSRHLRLVDVLPPGDETTPPSIDVHLSGEEGHTHVRLVHSGFAPGGMGDDALAGLDAGWAYFLCNLKLYLERHRGSPRTMAWTRATVSGSRDTLWMGILEIIGVDRAGLSSGSDTCVVTMGGCNHPGLNDALLFAEIESEGEKARVGIWLSTYGLDQARVAALQVGVDAAARALELRMEAN